MYSNHSNTSEEETLQIQYTTRFITIDNCIFYYNNSESIIQFWEWANK